MPRLPLFFLLAMPVILSGQEKVTFQDNVLPIFENHCSRCHNPDKKKGDLDLSSYSALLAGGGSGKVVTAGDPDGSKLHKAVTHSEEPNMPPNKPKIPDKEIDLIKRWIDGGLLETDQSKAVTATKPRVDLSVASTAVGKPDGPPPMPVELSRKPVTQARRQPVITAMSASPWAPLVAIGGLKQILLYHTDTEELLGILACPEGQPADLKFSRNGKLLLAGTGRGGQSGQVVVWEIETGKRLMTVGKEFDTVLACDISPDQTRVAMGGPDRLVKIFSTSDQTLQHKLKKHTDWVTALAFSPNGEFLATGDRNGGLVIWDGDSGQELTTLAGHKGSISGISWRDDSKFLASSSEDGSIKVWDPQEGKPARTWNAHTGGVLSVQYSHEGKLVSCGRDNLSTLWEGNGSKVRSAEALGEIGLRCAFSSDGARLVASDAGGRVRLFDTSNGKKVGELESNPKSQP